MSDSLRKKMQKSWSLAILLHSVEVDNFELCGNYAMEAVRSAYASARQAKLGCRTFVDPKLMFSMEQQLRKSHRIGNFEGGQGSAAATQSVILVSVVYICVCMYVRMYTCIYVSHMYACIYARMYVCTCVCMMCMMCMMCMICMTCIICMICMCSMYVCVYVRMCSSHVCMYVCIYLFMYVCV